MSEPNLINIRRIESWIVDDITLRPISPSEQV